MVAAIAAATAVFIVLESPFPIVQSTFAQDGGTFTADNCTGEIGNNADCRQQGCQMGSGNTQTNTFNEGDMNTTDNCQMGSGNTQTNTFD